jgi:hypothetical protein
VRRNTSGSSDDRGRIGMFDDPLLPATQRLPLQPLRVPPSTAAPSLLRPFVLRFTVHPDLDLVEVKHRTTSRPTRVPQKTHTDSKTLPDHYTVPDD